MLKPQREKVYYKEFPATVAALDRPKNEPVIRTGD
jgi:hypothetical protein